MDRKLIAIDAQVKYLSITWQVNDFCNYKCSYCNPGNWGGKYKNDDYLEDYIDNLYSIIHRYKELGYEEFKFFFSGGEPTAWKNFLPIVEFLRTAVPNSTIAVNTNLSRPLNWWKKHAHLFNDIVASFHVEFCDKDKYAEKSVYLCDKVNYLSSKLLLHDDRFWEVVEFGNHLKSIMPNYFIEWTPLFDEMSINTGPWKYNDPEKEQFMSTHSSEHQQTLPKPHNQSNSVSWAVYSNGDRESCNSNDIIVNRNNFFRGWECNVGDAMFISPVGEISLASCGVVGKIGHILDDVSRVYPKKVICTKEHCHCGTDIIIEKKKREGNIIVTDQ